MKVGFFTMPLHPPGSLHSETLDSDLEQLVLLDRLGFEEAWIGEHFTAEWENIPSPDLLIAQASAITKKMKLVSKQKLKLAESIQSLKMMKLQLLAKKFLMWALHTDAMNSICSSTKSKMSYQA